VIRCIVLITSLVACSHRPQAVVYRPAEETPPSPPPPPVTVTHPPPHDTVEPPPPPKQPDTGRREFAVATLPMGLALANGTLVWADRAGAIWMMPTAGGDPPRQISEQHRDGFATHPFVAGERVLVKASKKFDAVELPGGTVSSVDVTGSPGLIESAVGSAAQLFFTVFDKAGVFSVKAGGGASRRVAPVANAVLALHGGTLYIASYKTGELLSVPEAGGVPHTIAKKLHKPTALAVDDTAAYVYTEGDRKVLRIDLATGATSTLGTDLENSDELAIAGDAIYTVSWPHKLVRLPRTSDGPAAASVADDLTQPRGVVVDDKFVYVTSDSPPRVVRIPR
jgi:hypothetical protein